MVIESPTDPLQFTRSMAAGCRAIVTIPAKNEAATLTRCLTAFVAQVFVDGTPLPPDSFEIVLLLNNCTDDTAALAHAWRAANPAITLHVAERNLPHNHAHVGTARKLLMDAAFERLSSAQPKLTAILSTDADTVVAPDWISQSLHALEQGADVVGGFIHLLLEDLAALPPPLRHRYLQDRRYAALVAQLEDRLDPRPGDPWPRHLDHFGSSLAVTPQAYVRAGGMPAVTPLEDEAFIDNVRRANLILRHEPAVKVFTSARLRGRAELGLAKQFECWSTLPSHDAHTVPSAEFLEYRFAFMHRLRRIYWNKDPGDLLLPTPWWKNTVAEALANASTCPAFLGAIYCDVLIAESYEREHLKDRNVPIAEAISGLQKRLTGSGKRQSAPVQASSALPAQ